MRDWLDRAVTAMMLVAAAVVTAAVLRREFTPAPTRPGQTIVRHEPAWRTWGDSGRRIGPEHAALEVVVFSDIECPFCARFHARMSQLLLEHPDSLAMLYVHFPLPQHRQARMAAKASECAWREGRFVSMLDSLYARQASLRTRDSADLRPWVTDAAAAGVSDLARFEQCLEDTSAESIASRGVELGNRIGVRATPTVLLNGYRFQSMPDDSTIVRAMRHGVNAPTIGARLARLLGR